jgi:hypothetical protein
MSINVVNDLPATGPTLVPSGTTIFFKYEPFSYTFTGGTGFSVSGTLTGYCVVSNESVVFRQTTIGFQTTSAFGGETLTVTSSFGTLSYTIAINGGRFIVSPPISSIVLYQNEPISNTLALLGYSSYSNITFTSQTRLCNTTYTVPTLPSTLLTLTNPSLDGFNFVLEGRCPIVSASSNYFIIGSNSSNNYSVTTVFGIQVSNERIVMIPSTLNYALTLDSQITTPPTFLVFKPITAVAPVVFSSTNLPPGLSLSSNADSVSIVGTPSYPSSGVTSYTTTVRASAVGLAPLTTTSSISFSYTSSLLFTLPTTGIVTFYSNVPKQIQCTAVVFPTPAEVTYSSTTLPSGFTLSSNGLVSGTLTSTPSPITITANSGSLVPVDKVLTITVSNVPISTTITPSSSLNYIVGQTLSNTTIVFSSVAYGSSNFVSSVSSNGFPPGIVLSAVSNNSVQLTGSAVAQTITRTGSISGTTLTLTTAASIALGTNLTGTGVALGTVVVSGSGTTYTVSPSQTVLAGTVFTVFPTVSSGNLTITVNTIHGATSNVSIPYSFTADTFTFSTLASTPFSWVQNKPITPIQFFATTKSGTPVVYFYGDANLPSGLYVTPGGTLQGTPLVTTSSEVLSFNGLYSDNSFSSISPVTQYSYKVISDSILLTSPTPVTLVDLPTPSTAVISCESLTTVLFTTSLPHGLMNGSSVTLSGFTFSAAPLNGVQTVFSIPSPTSFLISSSVIVEPIDQNQVVSFGTSNTIILTVSTPVVRFITGAHWFTPGCTVKFTALQFSAAPLNGIQTILSVPSTTSCLVASTVITSGDQSAIISGIPAISITSKSFSGFIPSGPMTFTSYPYGLAGTANLISGIIGTLSYPDDIVLPEYHMVTATLNSSKVPTVFSLYNSNPQRINRFVFGYNSNTYVYTLSTDATSPFNFNSNLSTLVSLTPFNAIQFSSRLSLTSSQSVIVNGTDAVTVFTSINPAVVSQVSLTGYECVASLYVSSLSSWILFSTSTPSSLFFSSTPSTTGSWTNNLISGTHPTQTGYLSGHVLGYFNGKLLIGGTGQRPLVYSTIESVPSAGTSVTVTPVTNQRVTQVYQIVSSPDIVVACGVDDGVTIQYSSDSIQWYEAVMSIGTWPHAITTNIVYGGANAGWLAIGTLKSNANYSSALYSSDGITWTTVREFTEVVTSLQFDGSDWCILSGTNGSYSLRRHDPLVSTMTDLTTWTSESISIPNTTAIISMPTPIFTSTGSPNLTVYIGVTPNGPIFTSPTITSMLLYQYVVMTPIVVTATSVVDSQSLPVTYFLDSSLPPGMFWNSLTATLSGRSVELGTYTVVVYAQSTAGVSKLTLTFIVARVPIFPTLPTAASHTSYIREKVIADAATSSVNNRITPSEVGPFLLERPPAVTTAPEICCKEPTRTQA